jgi:hypothetical protein
MNEASAAKLGDEQESFAKALRRKAIIEKGMNVLRTPRRGCDFRSK